MRSKTQERIEELARERAAAAIDLALVEEGIEIGKQMMAEMIATYPSPGKSPGAATAAPDPADPVRRPRPRPTGSPARGGGSGYLNEVSRGSSARELASPMQLGPTRQAASNVATLASAARKRRGAAARRAVDLRCRRIASAARTTSRCSSTR